MMKCKTLPLLRAGLVLGVSFLMGCSSQQAAVPTTGPTNTPEPTKMSETYTPTSVFQSPNPVNQPMVNPTLQALAESGEFILTMPVPAPKEGQYSWAAVAYPYVRFKPIVIPHSAPTIAADADTVTYDEKVIWPLEKSKREVMRDVQANCGLYEDFVEVGPRVEAKCVPAFNVEVILPEGTPILAAESASGLRIISEEPRVFRTDSGITTSRSSPGTRVIKLTHESGYEIVYAMHADAQLAVEETPSGEANIARYQLLGYAGKSLEIAIHKGANLAIFLRKGNEPVDLFPSDFKH